MTTELIFEWSTFNFIFIFSQTIVYSSLVLKKEAGQDYFFKRLLW